MSDGEQCAAYVRRVTGLPSTSSWRRGVQVRGAGLSSGVAIATFSDAGLYENDTSGRSHCAIFIEEIEGGIRVLDAWVGHPAAERIIRCKGGAGQSVDDADAYHTIEVTM
jgi:hypothetical protein